MKEVLYLGIDIGSTTVKLACLDSKLSLTYSKYQRHFSDIKRTLNDMLVEANDFFKNNQVSVSITGSGGISISKVMGFPYIQEVIACTNAIKKISPNTNVVIELGGEDAKITYFDKNAVDLRMNGVCAGGTGAFIDQMATLLKTDAKGLNTLANGYKMLYPIAARCGVFAKTDIQSLINEGTAKEDIAQSIFQAVVNQVLGSLSCGKPVKGNVAFLGGPLSFLPELKNRFIETLKISKENIISPDNPELFVAIGAALSSKADKAVSFNSIIEMLPKLMHDFEEQVPRLKPLFKNRKEIEAFEARHALAKVKKMDINNHIGKCFLGLDAGSTTTKAVLIDENCNVLYTFYGNNEGNPLSLSVNILKDLYSKLGEHSTIVNSTVIGYGEGFLKAALGFDIGEVETVAHYKAASYFLPGVEFILDIGGQDMKYLKIKDGMIENIMLNEACSSGCGSFIQTFAKSLNAELLDFANQALLADNPVDLGTRCTVFMNSKVKQAQKDGATVGDISAGLSYSVVKNALFKVIKLNSVDLVGDKVIVQGGTFYNNAVLRSFELILGKNAVRPDIAGLMGAYGAAMISKEKYNENTVSTLISKEKLEKFNVMTTNKRCTKCSNNCILTVSKFFDNSEFIAGNRCEKGGTKDTSNTSKIPDLYEYKYNKIFSYKPLNDGEAKRGMIGIPRVLNMYENYPFWFTFLTNLKFKVILSERSSKKLYEQGLETIPSEGVCYPVKLVHGHIISLIKSGIKTIFYPCVPYETKEFKDADNSYNCPMVACYPEVIRNNIELLDSENILYLYPFISFNDNNKIIENLYDVFKQFNITRFEIEEALKEAFVEAKNVKDDIKKKGEEVLKYLSDTNKYGVVLAGRPYHIDPEINHGIPNIIKSYGMAVFTEDSICHLEGLEGRITFIDQWMYHSRLYRAASYVKKNQNIELIQLVSFGCGIDAITSEQANEILSGNGKIYSSIKIDEIKNLGAAKIRIRSLKAAIFDRKNKKLSVANNVFSKRVVFTKKMKKTHVILVPQMSPVHFEILVEAFKAHGYNTHLLKDEGKEILDEGLKYVNNDLCYPAIVVVGQFLHALKSGKYDLKNTSLVIFQSGGGCRFTNYTGTIRKALRDAGFEKIPLLSLSFNSVEKNPGFRISLGLVNKVLMAFIYGDLLVRMIHAVRPYEKISGSTNELYRRWIAKCKRDIRYGKLSTFRINIKNIVSDFENLEAVYINKPKVAVVGEIFLKYNPLSNNSVVDILENEGAEVILPDFLTFFKYNTMSDVIKHKCLEKNTKRFFIDNVVLKIIEFYGNMLKRTLGKSKRFAGVIGIREFADGVTDIVSLCNIYGEGWLLTAEIVKFLEHGIDNVLCIQPFSCLPNHITGRGTFKIIKEKFKYANLAAIDYDAGASEVNQLNRIKLFLSIALKELEEKDA